MCTLIKCCALQHFICVFTVCKLLTNGVSSVQRVKKQNTIGLRGLLMIVASVGHLSKEKRNVVAKVDVWVV